MSGPSSASHLSPAVKARFGERASHGYFSDFGGCGEDYLSGTQYGLDRAPVVLSAVAGSDGSVTVVIRRGSSTPNLTAVMAEPNGAWLAIDLASGTGPNASIFSASPNC